MRRQKQFCSVCDLRTKESGWKFSSSRRNSSEQNNWHNQATVFSHTENNQIIWRSPRPCPQFQRISLSYEQLKEFSPFGCQQHCFSSYSWSQHYCPRSDDCLFICLLFPTVTWVQVLIALLLNFILISHLASGMICRSLTQFVKDCASTLLILETLSLCCFWNFAPPCRFLSWFHFTLSVILSPNIIKNWFGKTVQM